MQLRESLLRDRSCISLAWHWRLTAAWSAQTADVCMRACPSSTWSESLEQPVDRPQLLFGMLLPCGVALTGVNDAVV